MPNPTYILTHDVGTTGDKACLYAVSDHVALVDSVLEEYPLYTSSDGSAEQHAEDWWRAICDTTRSVIQKTHIDPVLIKGISFCAQMQAFVPVDRDGNTLRNPMNYLDVRATEQIKKGLYTGLLRISGWNARKTIISLIYTGGMSATAKDPLWKYQWFREKEPELFKRMYKWLDAKEYLIHRCTGEFVMTHDSANVTFLYDTRQGHLGWSPAVCKAFNINMEHLPRTVNSTDIVGSLTPQAAAELGLPDSTPVFGGGGDLSLIPIGSGSLNRNDIHIYIGTSGWVVATVDSRVLDINNLVGSILGAIPGWYNYIAEIETAGICLQWVRDHLALDDIGLYMQQQHAVEKNGEYRNLYAYLDSQVEQTPPGAGNVLFAPWMHGNRSPWEDAYARGIFFNLSLETGKRQMVRAVLEGVAYHIRWLLESVELKIPRQETLRFVGGGAMSTVWGQIIADITGRKIEVVENAQNAGTVGAAVVGAVALGVYRSFQEARQVIKVQTTYQPRQEYKLMYDRNFEAFKKLYPANQKIYHHLNGDNKG